MECWQRTTGTSDGARNQVAVRGFGECQVLCTHPQTQDLLDLEFALEAQQQPAEGAEEAQALVGLQVCVQLGIQNLRHDKIAQDQA